MLLMICPWNEGLDSVTGCRISDYTMHSHKILQLLALHVLNQADSSPFDSQIKALAGVI